jgi:hypothetical protein
VHLPAPLLNAELPPFYLTPDPCPRVAQDTTFTDSTTGHKFWKLQTAEYAHSAAGMCDYKYNAVLAYFEDAATQIRAEAGLSLMVLPRPDTNLDHGGRFFIGLTRSQVGTSRLLGAPQQPGLLGRVAAVVCCCTPNLYSA